MLKGKKILLGVTGSIAAYKAAYLTRLLVKEGAEVKIILSDSAKDFVTPLTLSTLSGNPVYSNFTDGNQGEWNNHVELALWADMMLIAPATANTLAKCARGICDNLLLATYLSARCPVIFAPAMDLDMYRHGSTLANLDLLKSYGNYIIEPEEGELASGLVGKGRLAEPESIVAFIKAYFKPKVDFSGKKVMLTAGPTQESIDPVRYISNHSSGKMGFALTEAFRDAGAEVTLICGPVSIPKPTGVKIIDVRSAQDMFEAAEACFSATDLAVYVAAVADYTPAMVSDKKLKKSDNELVVELKRTPDIASILGKQKRSDQLAIGFALETDNALENAKDKLKRKNLDLIVLNSLQDEGSGFRYDTNRITVVNCFGDIQRYSLKSKKEVARDILMEIGKLTQKENQ